MSSLPGEWIPLRSPGAAAVGKEASAEPGGGRLCREHACLDSSLGYPEQTAKPPRCPTPSLGDRQCRAGGQPGAPGGGTAHGLAGCPREGLGALLPFVIPQFSSAASFLPRGERERGEGSQPPRAHHCPPPRTHCAPCYPASGRTGPCQAPRGKAGGRMGPTSSCGRGKPAAGGWSRGARSHR